MDQHSMSGYSGESGKGSLMTEQVKQGTQQAVQQTQHAAGQVTETAKEGAFSYADSQKNTAMQSLRSVADALHETGRSLQDKNQAPIAGYANKAADQVQGFAEYLEQSTVQDLIRDTEDFARQHSALFLGGALAIGFAAARFIKASSPRSGTSSENRSGTFGDSSYGDSQSGLGAGSSYASSAPYGDAGVTVTPSTLNRASTTGLADEVELPDATVFNADLETETTDGTSR
jgi:hypothetical protein